ncbi:MAG: YwbE family protein [Methanoculleus sp.]|nr:YwbE family protein [Methanoculleus sp.]MBP8676311.1 YwbE family protein [Methanoculleus sp.]HOD85531.1 YwbE family protein [Methanoculleus sp.]HPZ32811.1 YwbE family protein [Methanoculleus sp.]HRD25503.1 YwbE family protein [Methanoculleus sp.]
MNGQNRAAVRPGMTVDIVLKRDQRSGRRTRGVVAEILTNSSFHPHGIKVRLKDGRVGRVQEIVG